MLRTAGKLVAIDGGIENVPGAPVPITRKPRPSAATSPVQRYVIERVARVERVTLTENCAGFPACKVSPAGSTITNGTFGGLVSISCTGTMRDSNLYDFSMDSLRPSRAISSTQGRVLSGASPVKCSPLYFFCSRNPPVSGLNQ